MADLGLPDAAPEPGPRRRAVMEASYMGVHGSVLPVRSSGLAALDGHVGVDRSVRQHLRRADRVPADRRRFWQALSADSRGGVRRTVGPRDPGLLPLHAERPVRSDDRVARARRDRLPSQRAPAMGVLAQGPGSARPTRGVAVPRALYGL